MIAKRVDIGEGLQVIAIPDGGEIDLLRTPGGRTWIDLQSFTPDELERFLEEVGVTGLASRLCRETRDRPGFYPLKREIFLVVPLRVIRPTGRTMEYLALLCRENLLLTLHDRSVGSEQALTDLDDSDSWLPESSIAGVVASILIEQSLACLQETAELRGRVGVVEERMEDDPDSVEVAEIMELRSEVLAISSVVGDQTPSVRALGTIDKPFFRLGDAREYLSCAVANLGAAQAALTSLGLRIGVLRSGFEMHSQEKTNRRLGMLTILSAIFMPITLLAGIWGMNFEGMPELGIPFAYPMALLAMVLVGFAMHRHFKRGGWLDG